MTQRIHHRLSLLFVLLLVASCKQKQPTPENVEPPQPTLLQLLLSDSTGITFGNFVNDTGKYNFFSMTNIYNGGGVAIGDVNNDGLQDVFFTANQLNSRLYLNLGKFHFEDITESAGIDTRGGWTTAPIMADVNGDGFIDIYICRGGIEPANETRNMLFINKGNLTFQEQAKEYGIDDAGLTTSASFFDYDHDGDLDLYTLNYPVFDNSDPNNFFFYSTTPDDSLVSDKLFENINGTFFNVSEIAGLPIEKGSGLGLVVTDINQDGWQDIYVGNDWVMNDYVYINQKNKTFINQNKQLLAKNTFFSMGADVADVNNDALPDIFTADMAPASHYRRKVLVNQAPIDYYFLEGKYDQIMQYSRNTFELNKGNGFFEVGEFAGIAKTDWTWSTFFCDFDNDGLKDLFMANGMKRNMGHMDHEKMMYTEGEKPEYRHNRKSLVEKMPRYLLPNFIFKNKTGYFFTEAMRQWGIDQLVNTQGAAYADLNNDGSVDLILNNADTVAFIYQNTSFEGGNTNHYLRIAIKGKGKNTIGLGTKAWLYNDSKVQYAELSNARGFQSSSEPVLHFGTGSDTLIDSIIVVYPSFKYTVLRGVKSNQKLILAEKDAEGSKYDYAKRETLHQLFISQPQNIIPAFVHRESDFNDFKRDKLIPRMFSKEGPSLATGDLNGDRLEDFFAGGAAGQSGAVYLQQQNGTFVMAPRQSFRDLTSDSAFEDVGALIADLNNDGKNDLYIVSGSNEFPFNSPLYQDRIYLNDGTGQLERCPDCLPQMNGSKSCAAANDFDRDGDLDLFVGGRTVPLSYGMIPPSYFLRNEGGRFFDATPEILRNIGMVTDAQWVDVDNDHNAELVLCGDWMPVSIFKYSNSEFQNITASAGLQNFTGWWNCIASGDFDNDGDIDFACGNWGLNSILKASEEQPLTLVVNDFDENGSVDPILCCFLEGVNGTFAGRDLICRSMPKYFNKFHTYESFARAKVEDMFSKELYDKAEKLYAREMRTSLFINDGRGKFLMKPLPDECQFAPVNKILAHDFNGDGNADLLLLGNTNQNYYEQGDIDALQGALLNGDGKGNFSVVPYRECGLNIRKFVRSAAIINNSNLLVGCNDDTLRRYGLKIPSFPQ